MNAATIIAVIALACIIFFAARYIIKSKQRGAKCIGCPFSALAYMLISFFQAVEKGQQSLLLALLRKGILDIPLLFLLNSLLPPFGLAWATPAADIVCSITAVIFFLHFMKTHVHRDALLDSDEAEILVK